MCVVLCEGACCVCVSVGSTCAFVSGVCGVLCVRVRVRVWCCVCVCCVRACGGVLA